MLKQSGAPPHCLPQSHVAPVSVLTNTLSNADNYYYWGLLHIALHRTGGILLLEFREQLLLLGTVTDSITQDRGILILNNIEQLLVLGTITDIISQDKGITLESHD